MSLGSSLPPCGSIFLSLSYLVSGMGIPVLSSQDSCEQQMGSMLCSEELEGGLGCSVICLA